MLRQASPLARFHFVLAIIVMLLLMLGVMRVFERYSQAGQQISATLVGKRLTEQLALVHGEWLAEHYPEKVWSAVAPGGYFLMTSAGWPTDWIGVHPEGMDGSSCARLWRGLVGEKPGDKVVSGDGGCKFQFENQRVDYIFTSGNVMVY
jgi:hypothetical protein